MMEAQWLNVYAEDDVEMPIDRIAIHGDSHALSQAMSKLNRGLHCYCRAFKIPRAQTYTRMNGPMSCDSGGSIYTLRLTPVRDTNERMIGVTIECADTILDGVDVIGHIREYRLTITLENINAESE